METLKPWLIAENKWSDFKNYGQLKLNSIVITYPKVIDTTEIAHLLAGEQALVPVDQQEIYDLIQGGLSLVAREPMSGQIVGYQALGIWNEYNLLELRSAKVLPQFRGTGINSAMKQLMIKIGMEQFPDWPFIGFTEAASKSRGILMKFGFIEVALPRVKEEYPALSSICPTTCYVKTGYNCGCKVYLLNPHEKTH